MIDKDFHSLPSQYSVKSSQRPVFDIAHAITVFPFLSWPSCRYALARDGGENSFFLPPEVASGQSGWNDYPGGPSLGQAVTRS